jgi:hypothetical protein
MESGAVEPLLGALANTLNWYGAVAVCAKTGVARMPESMRVATAKAGVVSLIIVLLSPVAVGLLGTLGLSKLSRGENDLVNGR